MVSVPRWISLLICKTRLNHSSPPPSKKNPFPVKLQRNTTRTPSVRGTVWPFDLHNHDNPSCFSWWWPFPTFLTQGLFTEDLVSEITDTHVVVLLQCQNHLLLCVRQRRSGREAMTVTAQVCLKKKTATLTCVYLWGFGNCEIPLQHREPWSLGPVKVTGSFFSCSNISL